MSEKPVQVEFVYPSVKEQTKQAFIGTAIGLAPLVALVTGASIWSKIQDRRNAKNPVEDTPDPEGQ